jgi:Ca2+-transporting ATPase
MDNQKPFYELSTSETLELLGSSMNGLSQDEAENRLIKNGKNKLAEGQKRSLFAKLLDQFKDFMVLILIGAAVLSFVLAIINQEFGDMIEGFLILAIVIINALLGVFQEAKAEKALESIKKMSQPHATVLRDGKEVVIDVEDIVVGDIVILNAGDYMPADVRILQSINLKTDESALTGEPIPVEKNTEPIHKQEVPLGDRVNLGFMSTVVTYGRGLAVVVATGMDTEIGKIATLLSETENEVTPLQKNIAQLGKLLAYIALAIVGVIFIIQVVEGLILGTLGLDSVLEAFMISVALAVAAIPEGLPAIITIVLALGMQNLVKQRAIMRTLPAVETLGSTSIICSDKTGTLTQNIMTITQTYVYSKAYDVDSLPTTGMHKEFIDFGVLCNDTKVQLKEDKSYLKIGDPTEIALTDLAIAKHINPIEILQSAPRIYELPFDSERKLMTTVHKYDGKIISITKGAPDILISRATSVNDNGTVKPINNKIVETFDKANQEFADKALRVLAVGYREWASESDVMGLTSELLENDLVLLGLYGMIDPARPEVKDAIELTKKAGITTIMITGDHKNTAVAIASELGILEKGHLAITGKELDQMTDEEFDAKLANIRVYARVSPENKVRIVTAWKKTGLIVAMTGDGVNDAPSIKRADIGISMGITGTEVAKGAADMILTDDNFATIVGAVSEGRAIFANIKKAIHFLLSCNIGEIITILLGVTVGRILFPDDTNLQILTAAQLLWVNLVTDSFMAIGLGLEPKEPDIMNYPPRDNSKSIFSGGFGMKIAWQGIMIGALTFLAFFIGHRMEDLRHAQTLTFMVLSISQLFHAFNVRSEHFSTFKLQPNRFLIIAFFGCLLLQLSTVVFPVIANNVFGIDSVLDWNLDDWLIVIGLSLTPLIVVELVKLFSNLKHKA